MPVAVMVSLYTGLTVIEVPSSIISTRVPFRPARRPSSNCPAPLLLRSRTIAHHRTSRCLWTSCRPPLRWHKCHRNRWSLRRRSRRDRFRPMRRDSFSSCRLRDRQRGLPPPQVLRPHARCMRTASRERACRQLILARKFPQNQAARLVLIARLRPRVLFRKCPAEVSGQGDGLAIGG